MLTVLDVLINGAQGDFVLQRDFRLVENLSELLKQSDIASLGFRLGLCL